MHLTEEDLDMQRADELFEQGLKFKISQKTDDPVKQEEMLKAIMVSMDAVREMLDIKE